MQIEAIKQYIFQEGQPFQSSHASTVTVLPNRDVQAAWSAGKHDKSRYVSCRQAMNYTSRIRGKGIESLFGS